MQNFKEFSNCLKEYEHTLCDYDTHLPIGKEIGYQMYYLNENNPWQGFNFAFKNKKLAYQIYKKYKNDPAFIIQNNKISLENAAYLIKHDQ